MLNQPDLLKVPVFGYSLSRNMMEKDELLFRVSQSLRLIPESNFSCDFWRMPVPQVFNILNVDMSDKNPSLALIYPCNSAVDCSVQVGVD